MFTQIACWVHIRSHPLVYVFAFFYLLVLSFLFLSFLLTLLAFSFSGCTSIVLYDGYGYVRGNIWLQVMRDRVPHLVSTVSLCAVTAVHALFCFLASRDRFL